MSAKEIKKLLNNIKDKYSYEPYDTTGKVYTTISYEEGQLLLLYIEQLEKELKEEQEENYKQSEWLVKKQKKIEQLENNRDKAIEFMKNNSKISLDDSVSIIRFYKQLKSILESDSDYE